MIKRLRIKFIVINMLLVTIVLLIAFASLLVSHKQRLAEESDIALQRALAIPDGHLEKPMIGKPRPDDFKTVQNNVPVFTVILDETGQIISTNQQSVDIDSETLQQAVDYVQNADQPYGIIPALSLRYRMKITDSGFKIAFADRTYELNSQRNLLLTSLIVAIGGFIAFLFVSILLSNMALRPVEHAWQEQNRFVADASHELKTPLTVILANLGILQTHTNDTVGSQMKWISNTQTEAERMKHLIDDLLFLAKAEHATALTKTLVNVSDLVLCRLLPFESIAFERGVTIESDIAPQLLVWGYENQLGQLCAILFDNACKYVNDNGKIHVSLFSDLNTISLRVQNTGSLIQPDDLSHLFERFYRAEKSRVRDAGGYGLGLSIANSIVKAHHGKISVTSDASSGTAFLVTLKAANNTSRTKKGFFR